jgi:archaellum biogenesis ATPase FlaH
MQPKKEEEDDHSMERQLGQVTLQKALYERELVSSGIRELDEMLGGGFRPGTCNLVQEDLGANGLVVLEKMIEIQLSLDNYVLIILTDPTAEFFARRLEELNKDQENLIVLDFVKKSRTNIEVLFDKHELSLQIQEARQKLLENLQASDDEDVNAFVVYMTLNPFVMNLDERTIQRMLFETVLTNAKDNTISLFLFQKDIINHDYHARIASMFHSVIDLSSEYQGIQKMNYIRILKYVGRYFDPKIEPYVVEFDKERNKFNFMIKSAFLTTFDTYRALMEWQAGTIYLSKVPYILTPVAYMSMLLEIPLGMDQEKGKHELIEKGMAIGRVLTINTESLYHLSNLDLLKATVRSAALQGYGYIRVVEFQMDENLIILRQTIHPAFSIQSYLAFLEGFYRGLIRRALRREVRSIQFEKVELEMDAHNQFHRTEPSYAIKIRMEQGKPMEIEENND